MKSNEISRNPVSNYIFEDSFPFYVVKLRHFGSKCYTEYTLLRHYFRLLPRLDSSFRAQVRRSTTRATPRARRPASTTRSSTSARRPAAAGRPAPGARRGCRRRPRSSTPPAGAPNRLRASGHFRPPRVHLATIYQNHRMKPTECDLNRRLNFGYMIFQSTHF